MTGDRFIARLAEHGSGHVDPDTAFEAHLYAVLQGELDRRRPALSPLLLIAALVGILVLGTAIAVAGGLIREPLPDSLVPDARLDLATLDPCEVLPGPAAMPGSDGQINQPLRHDGNLILGAGMTCAYGWDDGTNPHFQIRDVETSAQEARALVDDLMVGETRLVVRDSQVTAWLGVAEWNGWEYVAVTAHRGPYLFTIWIRGGDRTEAGVSIPPTPINDRDRERAVELVQSVSANLDAMNDGRPVEYLLGRTLDGERVKPHR